MDRVIEFLQFTPALITERVGSSAASSYLAAYLGDLKASVVAIEPHYVDRHYLDDFANYYARSFSAPPAFCQRLHFFRATSKAELEELFDQALATPPAETADVARSLNEKYLGFVVRRPLEAAPIGRTVLRPYPKEERRQYEVVRPYRVHLQGFRLVVHGLAYQQQDGGAAVCASTALWSALQRVAYIGGHRTPTPFAITAAAKSPFPASHGLMEHQMAEAITSLGYSADRFVPAENRPLFRAKLMACLDSQLPVVLGIVRPVKTGAGQTIVGHAVTVTGYARPTQVGDVPTDSEGVLPLRMASETVSTLYVHDDNLGFHAHFEIFDSKEEDAQGNKILKLRRGRSDRPNPAWWPPDEWTIESALVPKPDKMRLPLEDLFLNVVEHRPTVERMFPKLPLNYRVRFRSGVEYLERIIHRDPLEREALKRFVRGTSLPRHLATMSVFIDPTRHLIDILMDATTVARHPDRPELLAIIGPGVPKDSQAWANVQAIATHLRVPFVPAPRS